MVVPPTGTKEQQVWDGGGVTRCSLNVKFEMPVGPSCEGVKLNACHQSLGLYRKYRKPHADGMEHHGDHLRGEGTEHVGHVPRHHWLTHHLSLGLPFPSS